MKRFAGHIRTYIFRGLFAIIPLALSGLAVQFLYLVVDKRAHEFLKRYIGFSIPGLGILLVLVLLYIIGIIASNVVGKQFFGLIENLTKRIPLVRTTYQIGKQLSMSLSLPEKQLFQRVVLVEFRPGIKTIGFVTGSIVKRDHNETLLKIFVPTVPNPTTGFIFVVQESQAVDPGWTVEEGLKMIISGGIIGPEVIEKKR